MLVGSWTFSYAIISRFDDDYRLTTLGTGTDGSPLLFGSDAFGGVVVAGYVTDPTLGYEFILLDDGLSLCEAFFFNRTAPNLVDGVVIFLRGGCQTAINGPYAMVGIRY